MKITFDPHTLSDWHARNITHISLIITDTGCAGHKIVIREGETIGDAHFSDGNQTFYYNTMYHDTLNGSIITHVGTKWILKSHEIHTRCGCGSSFGLKSGNPIQDKIQAMKLAMKEKKDGLHL